MTDKNKLEVFNSIQLDDDLTLEEQGKGRHFVSRFIEAGIAEYKGTFGKVLITKETLDRFIKTMIGAPVIIKHKDITKDNVDKERVGVVSEVWYNEQDGWFYCSGIIFDRQAIDLIQNQGWSVSCTYDFESDNKKGTYHGLEYDREFTDGNFLHLALVDNPRYERANIVMNSKVDNESGHWVTIKPHGDEHKGRHLFIRDGENVFDAMQRQWGVEVKGQQHLFDRKKYKSDTNYKEELNKKLQEHLKTVQKRYDNLEYLGVANPEDYSEEDYEDISFEEWEDKQKDKDEKSILDIIQERDKQAKEIKEKGVLKDIKKPKTFEERQQEDIEKGELVELGKFPTKFTSEYKKEETYHEDDMEESYTKEYGDSIKKDFEEFMKSKKEEKKEEPKQPESPFGEGVKVIEHDRGLIGKNNKMTGYTKDNKGASVEEFGENGGKYNVSFYEGTKRVKTSKTYGTKSGMEKAVREHLQGGANKETKALETKTDLEAAKTRYKDVLSKYNEADRKRWESGISPQEYHQAWTDYEKYKKELTGARREYAESIMSNFQEVENNPYEQRIEDKKMRYEEMATKTQAESNRVAEQSRKMMEAIPMGQPILVGHHSEMRDRRYRQRAWDKMGKAYELGKKADYYEDKAASVGTAGISSDDANAIAKLAQKYKSGVDSAEKRRIIDRVIDLHTRATSTKPESEATDYGFSIERNKDINRLQLKFDSIPDANTRAILKSNGFRWSPKEKAWQRQLNGNSEYSLKSVISKMKAENSLLEGIESILSEHGISKDDLPLLEGLFNILK